MKTFFSTAAFLLLISTAGLLTTACGNDTPVVPAAAPAKDYSAIDEDIIKKYVADNAITTAQRQTSGLYYVPVATNPAGVRAVAGKTVSVNYTGRYMSGTVFEASSYSFVLGAGKVIQGWDEGIALMRKGEKAELLIPSALAYGARGNGPIQPNTVLRFEVELVDVK